MFKPYIELAKPRLTAMVLVTTGAGFFLASAGPIDWARLVLTILGTGLAAVGAAAFNQILEADRDAQMRRTRLRPLPSRTISPLRAYLFASAATAAGLGILNEFVNPLTALLGLLNLIVYVAVYTPLKTRTSLNTLIGSICGAMPPIMGWTGAANEIAPGAAVLALVLFLWQVPHFLSLVWMDRDDYAKAGYRMLPVLDPQGRLTCLMIVLYSLALLPLGIAAAFVGVAGFLFAVVSLAAGMAFFLLTLRLWSQRSRQNARRVFLASLVYLPLLLLVMVLDARGGAGPIWRSPQRGVTASTRP